MKEPNSINHGKWRVEKYYVNRKPLSKEFELHVSAGLLINRFGINEKTIRNGIINHSKGSTNKWACYCDQNAIMFTYDSIPANSINEAKLPLDVKEAYGLLRSEAALQEEIHHETEINFLRSTFAEAYNDRWPPVLKFYRDKITDQKELILFAKAHALIEVIIKAVDSRWPQKIIFTEYAALVKSQLDALEEPKLSTLNTVYFWRVIRSCRQIGIPQTIIHDSLGVQREYKVKMTGAIKAFIRLLLRSPKRLTVSKIIDLVKKKHQVELSPSTVKRLKADNEDRNVLGHESNGVIYGRQNGLPKITRFLAEGPGEQYHGDFYKLQFYCRDHNKKVVRLWAYVVLDVFSKKAVGWALGEEPSAELAKDAFKMAFADHCIMPEEIIIDNDNLYKRPVFKRFVRRLNNLGVIVTKAYPNIPTWKAEIESFFAVFQKMHSAKAWYIGEDVQSKNTAGNPSAEYVKHLYTQVSSMLSISEMITEFGKMVQEYNYATNDRKKKVAPVDLFRMYSSRRTIKWEGWMEPLLFWETMTKKRIKNDGRIDLQIDGVEYCYQITKADVFWKHKNSDVRMCYDPNDLSKVHLFERGTLKYIGEIEPRMVMTRENKKEVMAKQRRILREAQQYLKDRRKEDENAVNGIVGVSPRKESLADRIIRRRLNRKKFEQEVQEVEVVE